MKRGSELKRGSGLSRGNGFKSKGSALKSTSTLKAKSQLKNTSTLSSKSKLKPKSSKQKEVDKEYYLTTDRMFQEREHICTGCRSVTDIGNLSHSHLIPRSRRSDLVATFENVVYHCIPCHSKWESVERVELLDYEENMKTVRLLDEAYYNMLIIKQNKYNN